VVKDEIRVTKTKLYALPEGLDHDDWAQFEVSLWKPSKDSKQPANFSLTGATYRGSSKREGSFGRLDRLLQKMGDADLLEGKDKMLPRLIKWIGFHIDRGPWYYIENSVFHYSQYLKSEGLMPLSLKSYKNPDRHRPYLDYFKSTVVLSDETIPEIPPWPRAPEKSDEYIYDVKTQEARKKAWDCACDKVLEDTLRPWLEGRLPRLMELFEKDMVEWFGPDIIETNDKTQGA